MARDTRKPVLYLRPFAMDANELPLDDYLHSRRPHYARAEPLILEPLKILGPVVAIGHPEEEMPPWRGAARLYPGDDWKSSFRELLDQAQLAVLFAGSTENFRWEVGQVFDHKPFVPTILIVPASREGWSSFRRSFAIAVGVELPDAGQGLRIIYFPVREQPIPFADTGDKLDRLLTATNPYLGAITRFLESIQPGSSAAWRQQAYGNKAVETRTIFILILVYLLAGVFALCMMN